MVGESQYPYTSGKDRQKGQCLSLPFSRLYKMTPAYRIGNSEEEIMEEIENNGPVQALMKVCWRYSARNFHFFVVIVNQLLP